MITDFKEENEVEKIFVDYVIKWIERKYAEIARIELTIVPKEIIVKDQQKKMKDQEKEKQFIGRKKKQAKQEAEDIDRRMIAISKAIALISGFNRNSIVIRK